MKLINSSLTSAYLGGAASRRPCARDAHPPWLTDVIWFGLRKR